MVKNRVVFLTKLMGFFHHRGYDIFTIPIRGLQVTHPTKLIF